MSEQNIEIILWLNGKKKEHSFKYIIKDYLNISLRRLKDSIIKYIKMNKLEKKILELSSKSNFEIVNIYRMNELPLGDYDIPYLNKLDILFFTIDNSSFKVSNHYNQYEFIKWIKSGGFGKVYLAKNIINNKEYAIKKIDSSNFSNQEIYNISREHMILRTFNHKNIIKLIDSFNYDNSFYTVMEYAKGGELNNLLNSKKRLSEKESKIIFKQIYEAVKYIHEQNIIHRDLKPNNILFLDEEKTKVVLIDFGISGFSNGQFKELIKAGTTLFLPPEVVSGNNFFSDIKIDVWSLGIILFRMIQGYYPFNGKNDKDIIHQILHNHITFNKNIKISNSCKELILNMLEKNNLFRIDMESDLFEKWFNDNNSNLKNNNQNISYEKKKDFSINEAKNVYFVENKKNTKQISHERKFYIPYTKCVKRKIHDFIKLCNNNNNNTNNSNNNIIFNNLNNSSIIKKSQLKNSSLKYSLKNNDIILPKINSNFNSANISTLNDSLETVLSHRNNNNNHIYNHGNKKLLKNLSCDSLRNNKYPFIIHKIFNDEKK